MESTQGMPPAGLPALRRAGSWYGQKDLSVQRCERLGPALAGALQTYTTSNESAPQGGGGGHLAGNKKMGLWSHPIAVFPC